MGYEGKLTCTNYFIILEKKFLESTPKIQMLMFRLAQTSHFGLTDIITPESQLAYYIYYVKYENTLLCKRISWVVGDDVLKIFFYFLYVPSDHFSHKIKPDIYGNRKSNAKS